MKPRLLVLVLALAALALATTAVLVAVRPAAGPAPPDFARFEPAGHEIRMIGDGHGTKLRSIHADVPSTLSWRLRVPARARLATEVSLDRTRAAALSGRSCRARVESRTGGQAAVVLADRPLAPGSAWEPVVADLEPARAHDVELAFSVACEPAPAGSALARAARWRVPVVSRRAREGPPNVLLVTVDTLRADHLGAYGYARPTSPRVDELARRGLLFRNAETVQSATWPALTSLHTSLHPSAHGVIWNGWRPRGRFVTLADLLDARGYDTSAFLANMKGAEHPGFSRLFFARGGDQAEEDRAATEAAIAQLERVRDRPFFLWIHLISPHADYAPPAPYDSFAPAAGSSLGGAVTDLVAARASGARLTAADVARIVGLYDGEIAYVDAQVGRVLDAVRTLGLEERTLVVFAADHGEDLHEHNRYFFHSPSMYSSSLRVPLIAALPGVLPRGVATDQPASLVDVAPTVLALLGLASPSTFQGVNLLPGGELPARPARAFAFGETSGKIFSVSTPEWRLVHNPERLVPEAAGGPYPIGRTELFDRRRDPREQGNVAALRPEVVRALVAEIEAWRRRDLREGAADDAQTIDPETAEELRALGYIVH
jgi:arylsulfatase A-like enzyme